MLAPHLNPLPSPRRRGGQPGNQNARKLGTFSMQEPGPLAPLRAQVTTLKHVHLMASLPPMKIIDRVRGLIHELNSATLGGGSTSLAGLGLQTQLIGLIARAAASTVPAIRRRRALQVIARDPLALIRREFIDSGISRDADSFFYDSKLSAPNSPLPRSHPVLATDLTDEQWAVLAPLIPPEPREDWLSGRPPVIVAANRWRFSGYQPGSELNDFTILQEHDRILQRFPALAAPSTPASQARKRGRPRRLPVPPRALLDAIFWKLATGHTWSDLPIGFPPVRVCRDYYRRLFLSGRFFTLLLALYNHLCLEADIDPSLLVEDGIFSTTPGQKITLTPGVPPAWQNYTALLFMQLARRTYSRLQRERKQANPLYLLLPDFKGNAPLSTGKLSVSSLFPGRVVSDLGTVDIRIFHRPELQSDWPYRKMKSGRGVPAERLSKPKP